MDIYEFCKEEYKKNFTQLCPYNCNFKQNTLYE